MTPDILGVTLGETYSSSKNSESNLIAKSFPSSQREILCKPLQPSIKTNSIHLQSPTMTVGRQSPVPTTTCKTLRVLSGDIVS